MYCSERTRATGLGGTDHGRTARRCCTGSPIYEERINELAAIITREMGKTTARPSVRSSSPSTSTSTTPTTAATLLADEPIPSDAEGKAWVRKSPVGPLLGIMPWNYPYYQVARFAGPEPDGRQHDPAQARAAVPGVGRWRWSRSSGDAGLPDDAYINVFATNEQVADIIADPRVHGVSVTGCERAGAAVAEIAGRNLKKVVLELGGSDPFIVLDTDDVDGDGQGRCGRPDGERRPGLQRGQAVHRRRRALRRVRGRSSRQAMAAQRDRRPDRPETSLRAAVLGAGGDGT